MFKFSIVLFLGRKLLEGTLLQKDSLEKKREETTPLFKYKNERTAKAPGACFEVH